jgi:hypothetical protein
MPPDCDSLDGPVVAAARHALHEHDVNLVLPYVSAHDEDEVRDAFERVLPLRGLGTEVAALADQWFFETVVRLHREAEHAPYAGLRPAGHDVGPVIPLAEKAVESGDVEQVYRRLAMELRRQLSQRLRRVARLAADADESVAAAREFVHATLGFQTYAHGVYQAMRDDGPAHG